ncbi:MAG: hypothetical protein LQ339_003783 [Xanthoria mediterranea]|nr:MAG: hypothetical protein LQ339_003783 [Xanthoria mediterranea]
MIQLSHAAMQQTPWWTAIKFIFTFGVPILLSLLVPFELGYFHSDEAETTTMATKPSNHNLNVFRKPLALFSQTPMTGFYRDGYCRTGPEDGGNHAIAALLTKEFLDFSAARGNNLRQVPGLKEGCKWCLCTARWKEAVSAAASSSAGADTPGKDGLVPKVFLHATDESALSNGVTMEVLKKYAAEPEAAGGGGSLEGQAPITPGTKGGVARETH